MNEENKVPERFPCTDEVEDTSPPPVTLTKVDGIMHVKTEKE